MNPDNQRSLKRSAIIAGLFVSLTAAISIYPGCTLTADQKEKTKATGAYVAQRVGEIALKTVLNAAVSQVDQSNKGDWMEGLAQGFRTQEGSLVTANDVKNLVAIWTPQKDHWRELGDQVAALYAREQPKTPQEAATLLESIARGLEATAERAK